MIIEDQWKFVNAHGQEQAKAWLKTITDGLTESRDTNKLNKLNKTSSKYKLLPRSYLIKVCKKIPVHP